MTRPAQPVLTARSERSEGSFAAGRDVVVGSDLRADLRMAHPLIARAHVLLRFEQGRWIPGRRLNGDEAGLVLGPRPEVRRISLYRWPLQSEPVAPGV